MKSWKILAAVTAIAASWMPGAQAAAVQCGNLSLGTRTTTVDPALACTYAGLTNLGNGALETLLSGITAPDAAILLNRDTSNNNGGLLNITGVGGQSGTWTIDSSVWNYGRVFLYFHFGDAKDAPGTGSTTDPDTFIVELARADLTGDWSFGGGKLTGLSNIGLLGSGTCRDCPPPPPPDVPEPGTLALLGLGLLGLAGARRRKL